MFFFSQESAVYYQRALEKGKNYPGLAWLLGDPSTFLQIPKEKWRFVQIDKNVFAVQAEQIVKEGGYPVYGEFFFYNFFFFKFFFFSNFFFFQIFFNNQV